MNCGKCGRNNKDDAKCCVACGEELTHSHKGDSGAAPCHSRAYVEIAKGGKVVMTRPVDIAKARKGCQIRIGNNEIHLAVGQSKVVDGYDVRVYESRDSSIHDAAGDTKEEPLPAVEGYKILGALGHGGMGTVWRAVQLSTNRTVALKLLSERHFDSPTAKARFHREVEVAAKLEHPNIARVYDSGMLRNSYFYAMELIDGVEMDKHVRAANLTQRQNLDLMRTICQAVDVAHRVGVVHRDIKPSNILVTRDGQPHVLDFGLAKTFTTDDSGVTISVDGAITGTPAYMSPEQAGGRHDEIDARSDVYSLGVLLYRMLTGKSPVELTGTSLEIMGRIMAGQLTLPSKVARDVKGDLEAIILKALASKRFDRYRTAGDLARDIEQYLKGEPVSACKATATYVWGKRIRKHRLPLAVAAGVAAMFLGMIVWFSGRQGPTPPVAPPSAAVEGSVFVGDTFCNEVAALPAEKQIEHVVQKIKALNPGFDMFAAQKNFKIRDREVVEFVLPRESNLKDISPLRALRSLEVFDCRGSTVADLSPLQDLAIRKILSDGEVPGTGDGGEPQPAPASPVVVDKAFIGEVALLPPEEQAKRVTAKIKELNPGYDGEESHKIENGVVVDFRFPTKSVRDISPVAALRGLKLLSSHGKAGEDRSPLADLSPLKGLPLEKLDVSYSAVEDLSPLQGMGLIYLNCKETLIADFSQLRGFPLARLGCSLEIAGIPRNREALQAIPTLQEFKWKDDDTVSPAAEFWKQVDAANVGPANDAFVTEVAALPPEEQVARVVEKLKELNPGYDGAERHQVANGQVVGLELLPPTRPAVTNLAPIRALAGLKSLTCGGYHQVKSFSSKLSNLAPLKGLALTRLWIRDVGLIDLSPLAGMPLKSLELCGSRVRDLNQLRGLPLEYLGIHYTGVSDLSPLAGMPLKTLICNYTRVGDLAPLKGMPLEYLHVSPSPVRDLTVLRGMPLKTIFCDPGVAAMAANREVLLSLTTLQKINNKSVSEFWKKIDDENKEREQEKWTSIFDGKTLHGWDKRDDGKVEVRDGAIALTHCALTYPVNAQDVAIRATVSKGKDAQNLSLRLRGNEKGQYVAYYKPDEYGFQITKKYDGTFTILKSVAVPKLYDGFFTMTFRARGKVLTLEVNGQEIVRAEDGDLAAGEVQINSVQGTSLFKDIQIAGELKRAEPAPTPSPGEEKWTSIFDGKTLQGWVEKPFGKGVSQPTRVNSGTVELDNMALIYGAAGGDVAIRSLVKIKSPYCNVGLRLRSSSNGDHYTAQFNGKDFKISKWRGSAVNLCIIPAPKIFDDFFEMTFRARGKVLTLDVDRKEIARVEDSALKSGSMGIHASKGIALFKDIQLSGDFAPADPSQPASTQPGEPSRKKGEPFAVVPGPEPVIPPNAAEIARKRLGNVYTNAVKGEMVCIPAREFMLGCSPEEREWALKMKSEDMSLLQGEATEFKKAKIANPFWLGRTEVTVGQWKQFVEATKYVVDAQKVGYAVVLKSPAKDQPLELTKVAGATWKKPGFTQQDTHPVCAVSWRDAMAFCAWLTEQEKKAGRLADGFVIRLPTEAEWEHACRAGTKTRYWWGDEGPKGRVNLFGKDDGFGFTSPVDFYGARGRNAFGLADMLGNVSEFCMDGAFREPQEEYRPGNWGSHAVRGGSFLNSAVLVRVASRNAWPTKDSWCTTGFRVCCGVQLPSPGIRQVPSFDPQVDTFGMYYHFDITTYVDDKAKDLGKVPAKQYRPLDLDAKSRDLSANIGRWVDKVRETGATFAVLTTKHSAGFCLWPSDMYDYSVAQSPVKLDVVGEFVDACKVRNILPGLHYSIRDAHNNSTTEIKTVSPAYFEIIKKHITELHTNYPDVRIQLFADGGLLSEGQYRELCGIIKNLNPQCVIFLLGNSRQNDSAVVRYEHATVNSGWHWSLTNMMLTGGKELYDRYQAARAKGYVFLLNVGPDRKGELPPAYSQPLADFKKLMTGSSSDR